MTRGRFVRGNRIWVVGLFLAVIALAAWLVIFGPLAARKPCERFTMGKATTSVTGPVDQEGLIDYVTALNERLSEHIKPADNANVLLWQALGPHPEDATMPPGYFRWLGMARPPEHGAYWTPEKHFLDEHPKFGFKLQPMISALQPAELHMMQATRRPWKAKEFPWIAAWLKDNAKPLDLAIQASHRSAYFNPLLAAWHGVESDGLMGALVPSVLKYYELTNALTCRALLALGEGRPNDAWQDLLACHRLGRLVARGGTLIEFLVGVAIDRAAGQADVALLASGHLDAKQILADLPELQSLPPFPSLADKMDRYERLLFLDDAMVVMSRGAGYLEAMAGDGPRSERPSILERVEQFFANWRLSMLDWDSYLRSANQWFDRLAAALRIGDRAARQKALAELTKDLEEAKATSTAGGMRLAFLPSKDDGKALCNVMMSLLMPALLKIVQANDRVEQVQNNLYVAFALAAYRQDHGRYPENLAALAPKYLARVPPDLFTGKPLVYRPSADGYLLYSVGINGKDEDGRGYEDVPSGDDLSVRMPPATVRIEK